MLVLDPSDEFHSSLFLSYYPVVLSDGDLQDHIISNLDGPLFCQLHQHLFIYLQNNSPCEQSNMSYFACQTLTVIGPPKPSPSLTLAIHFMATD